MGPGPKPPLLPLLSRTPGQLRPGNCCRHHQGPRRGPGKAARPGRHGGEQRRRGWRWGWGSPGSGTRPRGRCGECPVSPVLPPSSQRSWAPARSDWAHLFPRGKRRAWATRTWWSRPAPNFARSRLSGTAGRDCLRAQEGWRSGPSSPCCAECLDRVGSPPSRFPSHPRCPQIGPYFSWTKPPRTRRRAKGGDACRGWEGSPSGATRPGGGSAWTKEAGKTPDAHPRLCRPRPCWGPCYRKSWWRRGRRGRWG